MVNRYNKQNGKAAAEVNRCNKKEKKKKKWYKIFSVFFLVVTSVHHFVETKRSQLVSIFRYYTVPLAIIGSAKLKKKSENVYFFYSWNFLIFSLHFLRGYRRFHFVNELGYVPVFSKEGILLFRIFKTLFLLVCLY